MNMKANTSELLNEKPNAEKVPISGSASIVRKGHYLPPPQDKDGRIWVRTSALIERPADDLYALWRDVEFMPRWQEEIANVSTIDEKKSHWVMRSGDKTIEWDSEVLADEPGKRIAWHSIEGELHNAGEVIFESLSGSGDTTMVIVLQEFRMGKITSAWETFVGRNPKQAVIENLRHFKAFAETGEIPRTQGQPHGQRGIVAGMKGNLHTARK